MTFLEKDCAACGKVHRIRTEPADVKRVAGGSVVRVRDELLQIMQLPEGAEKCGRLDAFEAKTAS